MILLGFSDVAEYVGKSRQFVRSRYIGGHMPKPHAFTYKDGNPLWTKDQIKECSSEENWGSVRKYRVKEMI